MKASGLPHSATSGRLAYKRAVITGGANGIGHAVGIRFAAEGARVALLDHERGPLQKAVADIHDESSMRDAFKDAEAHWGGLDVVVANAAIEPANDDRVDRLSAEVWQSVIDTNLTGVFLTCKFGLQALLRSESRNRSIICTVSPTGIRGSAPGQDAYSASKAGVLGLTRVLAHDVADDGIRVNGVMPGFTDTRANARILQDPDLLASVTSGIPMNRPGLPDEVAAVMVWVASDEASYVTGAIFAVDGGQTAV
jgi:3-oxoacyl-[acyl-carrier protein] reductase